MGMRMSSLELFRGYFSFAPSIQSYGTRPQAETLRVSSLRFPVVPVFRSQREKFNTFVGRGTWATHTLCPPRGGCEKDTLETTVNKTDLIPTIKAS